MNALTPNEQHAQRGEFRPRRAVVTGADSGIGRATAVALAHAGMDVGITWHADEDGGRLQMGPQAGAAIDSDEWRTLD